MKLSILILVLGRVAVEGSSFYLSASILTLLNTKLLYDLELLGFPLAGLRARRVKEMVMKMKYGNDGMYK